MMPRDHETIRRAAADRRLSVSAFVSTAALAACRASLPPATETLDDEAETALAALTQAGLTAAEAKRRIQGALRANPHAAADALVAAAFGACQ